MIRRALIVLVISSIAGPVRLDAQRDSPYAEQYAERGPRFFASTSTTPVRIDVARTPALRRRITVDLENATVSDALEAIAKKGGLRIMYSPTVLPLDRHVRLKAEDITIAAALTEVLLDMDADVLFAASGQAAVVKRIAPKTRTPLVPVGTVTGRVTDARSGVGIPGAQVMVEQTRLLTAADDSGRYRLTSVPAGAQRITARRIGYTPRTVSVTVTDDGEANADIALQVSTSVLSEVVVTGAIVPTELKALPTPVTVVNASTIEGQHVRNFDQIIRLAVPGAVVWDQPASSFPLTDMSVRGASGIGSVAAKAPKVYIDGVEVTVRHLAPVDPESIDHIEIVRGPQAAAIYGSDAMGGVIQIFTKRGTTGLQRPEIDASAAVGTIKSDFPGDGALQQDYSAALQGSTSGGAGGYRLGGGYSRTGDWIPEFSMITPSANGGVRLEQGNVTMDLSGRVFWQNGTSAFDPRFKATGALPTTFGAPSYLDVATREETYAAQVGYQPRRWWQHHLMVGADRWAQNQGQTRQRRVTPADTLLRVSVQNASKMSIAYNTTATATLSPSFSAAFTAGADHYVFSNDLFSTTGALSVVPLRLATGQTVTPLRDHTTNTGLFGQVQLNVRDALFLTAAVRSEANTGFGEDLGRPILPRVGVSYAHDVGAATVKVRGSYGEAIRPASSAQKNGSISLTSYFLANPRLKPERMTGPDAGLDLVFGGRGSLSVTYYDQIAKDLIQSVTIDASTTPRQFQYQNLARVKNKGLELEGTVSLGRAALRGQWANTSSKPEDLGTYQGTDYKVGEQFPDLPRNTAGLMLTATPVGRTTISAGLSYVGSWKITDYLAYYGCVGKATPCKKPGTPAPADYVRENSGFTTVNLSVQQPIVRGLSGFLAVDDATNKGNGRARSSLTPQHGRVTTVGMRMHY
jgi:outer membrane receptor protein involved in Fe transport